MGSTQHTVVIRGLLLGVIQLSKRRVGALQGLAFPSPPQHAKAKPGDQSRLLTQPPKMSPIIRRVALENPALG